MDSLQCAGHTLGRLKLSQLQLEEDAASKAAALKVDMDIVRMRKRQATMHVM